MVIFIVCILFIWLEQKNGITLKTCENKDFCNISMPSEEAKILEFTQYQKSDNVSFYKLCRSWMFNRKD